MKTKKVSFLVMSEKDFRQLYFTVKAQFFIEKFNQVPAKEKFVRNICATKNTNIRDHWFPGDIISTEEMIKDVEGMNSCPEIDKLLTNHGPIIIERCGSIGTSYCIINDYCAW